MTLEVESETKRLQQWFVNMMKYFRTEYEKIPDEEKKQGIDNNADFCSPCQIEVFWLEAPARQIFFKSNFKYRKDMEVIVNGPFNSHEFIDRVEPILSQPHWEENINDDSSPYAHGQNTYAYALANHLHYMIEQIKAAIFNPKPYIGQGMGQWISRLMWVQYYNGNIADSDYVAFANEKLERTKMRAREIITSTQSKELKSSEPGPKSPKGHGVYFYPPIIIGEKPKVTPSDVLRGKKGLSSSHSISFGERITTNFGSRTVSISMDGFILVPISDKQSALKALNVIMAVGILRGLDFLAVREHELSEVEYDPNGYRPVGMSYNPSISMRTRLLEEEFAKETPFSPRREVSIQTITEIINKAGQIYELNRGLDDLRILSEAFTHLNDAEYAQSFVMSWTVIERFIFECWRKKIDESDIEGDRMNKLLNAWSVDYQLEVLSLINRLKETEYDTFMEMKHKRNRFIHKGKPVEREDAERCFRMARDIVSKKVSV